MSYLIEKLNNSSKDEYSEIGVRLDIPIEQFLPYTYWNNNHYTRNCIVRTDHYELILLCWEKGQDTPIHCHGNQECWVYVVDGKLDEEHYQYEEEQLLLESTETLAKGEKSFMCDDLGFHKLINAGKGRSMSLHLYMNPIDKCTKFNEKTHAFESIDLSYYSYAGKKEEKLVTT